MTLRTPPSHYTILQLWRGFPRTHSAAYHTCVVIQQFLFVQLLTWHFHVRLDCNMPRVLRFGREGFVYMIYPSRYHTHVFSTYSESMGGYVAIDLQKYVG